MESYITDKLVEAIQHTPIASVGIVAFAVCVWLTYRFLDERNKRKIELLRTETERKAAIERDIGKQERAKTFAAALDKLSQCITQNTVTSQGSADDLRHALNNVETALTSGAEINRRLVESQDDTSDAVRALVAISRGAMSAEDSRRLVMRELDSLRKEVYFAFCASLRHNHYRESPDGVELKIRDGLHEQFDRTIGILASYKLAISPKDILLTYKNSKDHVRYKLIDDLWLAILPLYKSPIDYNDVTLAKANDVKTGLLVKTLFRDAIDSGIDKALGQYLRDPSVRLDANMHRAVDENTDEVRGNHLSGAYRAITPIT